MAKLYYKDTKGLEGIKKKYLPVTILYKRLFWISFLINIGILTVFLLKLYGVIK